MEDRKMKIIFKLLLVGFLIAAFGEVVYAQGEAAVPFLELAPDSRAGGMGESGGGLADNSAAIFWNPAGLAFQTGTEVSITHSNWLPQFHLDLFYDYLTYKQYFEEISGIRALEARGRDFSTLARDQGLDALIRDLFEKSQAGPVREDVEFGGVNYKISACNFGVLPTQAYFFLVTKVGG